MPSSLAIPRAGLGIVMALVTWLEHILYEYCVPHARLRKEEKVVECRERNITQTKQTAAEATAQTGLQCGMPHRQMFHCVAVSLCVILAAKLQLSQTPRVSVSRTLRVSGLAV